MRSIFSIEELRSIFNFPGKDKRLEKVAVEFEAIFLQKLLSELSSSTENPFFSPQTRFWEKMYIMQIGEKMAEAGGIGLKKYIINAYKKYSG
ncbi:MAG: hypothetical protein DSY34_00165 [Desulfurobacterium sp.]|nr:MAG: hypothetical protein DSY34_00165 [Desulfurobacterium sp.]